MESQPEKKTPDRYLVHVISLSIVTCVMSTVYYGANVFELYYGLILLVLISLFLPSTARHYYHKYERTDDSKGLFVAAFWCGVFTSIHNCFLLATFSVMH